MIPIRRFADTGLLCVFIISCIFAASFAAVNVLKFRVFSETSFGWQFMHFYPKLAFGTSLDKIFFLPEYPVVFFLFTPINFILAFVYRLLPHPQVLLVSQSIIMASGAVPVYLLAKQRLSGICLPAALSVAYLFHPIVTTGAMLGFIPLAIGLPFLLWAFFYLEKNDLQKTILFVILANSAKIDVVVMTLILGLILLFASEKKKCAKSMILISVCWLFACLLICVLYFFFSKRPFPLSLLQPDQHKDNIAFALRVIINDPLAFLSRFYQSDNMLAYVLFRIPNIFALLFPVAFVPVIPEMVFLAVRNQHSSGHFFVFAFLFGGAIYGLERFLNFVHRLLHKAGARFFDKSHLKNTAAGILIAVVLFQHYYYKPECSFSNRLGSVPFNKDFSFENYRVKEHDAIGNRFVAMIPSGVSCLTMQSIAWHLGQCRLLAHASQWVIKEGYPWEYVLLDLSRDDFQGMKKAEFYSFVRALVRKDGYGVIAFEDGWLLLKRGVDQSVSEDEVVRYMECRP